MANGDILQQPFLSITSGPCTFSEVIQAIVQSYNFNPTENFKVSVGTDSEEVSGVVKFVTAIVLWRVGHGARAWRTVSWGDPKEYKKTGWNPKRIYEEVVLTGTLTVELRSQLHKILGESVSNNIEVHADVGESGRTSVLMREIIGMLLGYGFPLQNIKWKPESIAASVVADRYI
ncbi:MAG: hypothetical protein UU22_C0033G0010 [Parcubacteria group bacterium GW2011_GWA2_40_8]|uniref:DUF458 domain-containing protein n=1 Tax=Candidatus Terrybacteria bacterium RIFCSPLOWO2_01_FULL_40_23 TaxID=1802366 RepID=A0A1G2PQP3_9BACT|nr:MAG: hypothetical protein UT82_C0004G0025 [Parcubacteria group bacterium GW2011_GWB1_40_14]KKR77943.1 MAG: hypothetical protein UU22_C0033G0010 [Parcubacteria group bacterium GW2011_GWA2_40_8]OHA50623.1 MAG: hypothetical protein A3A97_04190 [Candidatus Terrybacteria bacterium RIFCSPLOWO2_01_FULL_40_23]